jgi:GNAT superfamily N-acetyltransferase
MPESNPVIDIRPLTSEIVRNNVAHFIEMSKQLKGDYWVIDHYLTDYNRKWELSSVAYQGDVLIGFCIVSEKPESLHVHRIVVDKSCQNYGIGKALIRKTTEDARRLKKGAVTLKAEADNDKTISFYRHLGFEITGAQDALVLMTFRIAKCIAIHQPNFIPWVGYFNKIKKSDVFVLFDDVQFPRAKTFGNRVEIKTNNGAVWLTVPVTHRGELNNFNEIEIDNNQNWAAKSLKTIKLAYQKAVHFNDYWEEFAAIYTTKYQQLTDLNIGLMRFALEKTGIDTPLVRSSEIVAAQGRGGEDKIMAILKSMNATVYLSGKGAGSKRYINEADFDKAGIQLMWQTYEAKPYRQLWGGDFVPNLSIIDLLFNEGPNSIDFIK